MDRITSTRKKRIIYSATFHFLFHSKKELSDFSKKNNMFLLKRNEENSHIIYKTGDMDLRELLKYVIMVKLHHLI